VYIFIILAQLHYENFLLNSVYLSSGKTFAVRMKNGHLRENFGGCMLVLILILLIDKAM